jgi:hypothetical protein
VKRVYQILLVSIAGFFLVAPLAAQATGGASGKTAKPRSQIVVRPGPPVKPTGPAKPVGNQKSDWGGTSGRKASRADEK